MARLFSAFGSSDHAGVALNSVYSMHCPGGVCSAITTLLAGRSKRPICVVGSVAPPCDVQPRTSRSSLLRRLASGPFCAACRVFRGGLRPRPLSPLNCGAIPVEDLLAGPEDDAVVAADVGEGGIE